MRKILLAAVAASMFVPTVAQAQRGPDNRTEAREGRQDRQDARRDRRGDRTEARTDRRQDRREDRVEARQDRREDRREDRRDARQDRSANSWADIARQTRDARERAERQRDRREYRQEARRDAAQDRRDSYREARRDDRQTRRAHYRDWREYRRHNPRAFRLGAYVGPRGFRYRPLWVGYRFPASAYYGSRYWLSADDYYLPQPRYGYQRWIRYGDDALLVDIRSGNVIAVHRDFFWR